VGHRPRNTPPDSNGPVKVEVPAPYVKTTEQADPVSCQDLLVETLHCYRSALPSILLPLQPGRGDLRGAVSRTHAGTSPVSRAGTRRSMSSWIAPLECRPARSSGSQSGSARQGVADLDPDRPSFIEDRTVQVMVSSRSSSASSRISASG
jgi:hypothetical protein